MNRQCRSRLAERIFWSQHTPLLASPQGGEAASSIKFREATEADADGVVFLSLGSENHPGLAVRGCCATFLLIARPPLLAVMQGGEWPLRNIRTFFTRSN